MCLVASKIHLAPFGVHPAYMWLQIREVPLILRTLIHPIVPTLMLEIDASDLRVR